MPDRNLFDDDSLIPEWMRNTDEGGSEEDSSFDLDSLAAAPSPATPRAPWERLPGAPPPRPARMSPAAPPWEQYAGGEVPAPEESRAASPWGAPAAPEDEAPPPTWGATISTGSSVEIEHDFEWSSEEPQSGPAGPRSGLTSMLGDLPWMEQQSPPPPPKKPQPPVERPITMADLMSEFDQTPPAEPPPPPSRTPSLADRLRAASPKPAPESMTPQEADWMSGFGQASGTAPAGDESDLDWLMPPSGEAAAPSGEQIEELFDDEFAAVPPAEQPAGPGFEEQDLPWLSDEDQGAPPAADDFSLDWLRAEAEEAPDSEPSEPEPLAPEPPKIRKLGQSAPLSEQPAGEPPKIRKLGQSAPLPAQPTGEPPKIRKLGQSAPLSAPPEPEPQPMTYEEWEQLQVEKEIEASKSPEDRLLEEVPDWLKSVEPPPPSAAAPAAPPAASQEPEFMPGWFMGLEETSAEEAPDWLQKMDYSSDLMAQPFASAEPPAPLTPEEADIPDWFKGAASPELDGMDWNAMFGTAEPPAAPATPEPEMPDWLGMPEQELPPVEEELPMPDLLGAFDEAPAEPGEMPDWLGMPEQELPPVEEELPMPDLLGDLDEAPAGREIASPEEVPFPDLDLDQAMPGESTVGDVMSKAYQQVLDQELPLPPSDVPDPSDFVERFDPFESESAGSQKPASVTRRSLDDDAPDWLREMASEQEMPTDLVGDVLGSEAAWTSDLPPEEELDWLGDISAADVAPVDYAALVAPEDRPVTDMPPRPAPGSVVGTGLLETGPVDSATLDRLLGQYEPRPPAEEEPMLDALWGEEPPSVGEVELWETEAPSGAPEAPLPFEMPSDDLESRTGQGESLPDLEALFDEAGFEEPFPAEEPPLPEPEPPQEPPARPVPEARPRFKLPRKGQPPAPAGQTGSETPAQPEWVSEMRPSDLPVVVRAGGAETSVKQKQVVELPERLRAFREETLRELGTSDESAAPAQLGPLAGITGALSAAAEVALPKTAAHPVEGLIITKEQQARLNRLQALLDQVAAEEDLAEQDKAGFEEAAWMAMGGAAPAAEAAPSAAPRRARRHRRFKLDRVLVAILLLAALILPFGSDALHFGEEPAALSGDRQSVAVNVDTVSAGRYVLFAFEYGPTAAGELDPLAEAVLRDVLAHQGIPLILSTNAAGVFHASAVVSPLANDARLLAARGEGETSLEADQDYFILSYLPGEAVGVRSLRNTTEDAEGNLQVLPAFKHDLRGDSTGLNVASLDRDIALIVVVGEDSNAVRMWAEQLDGVHVPKLALVTAALEPLAIPYVNKDAYAGYLAGVRDAYSYNAARNAASSEPYTLPADLPVDLPNPEQSRWHSMALGAAAAAGLIAFGMVINLLRGLTRRRRR